MPQSITEAKLEETLKLLYSSEELAQCLIYLTGCREAVYADTMEQCLDGSESYQEVNIRIRETGDVQIDFPGRPGTIVLTEETEYPQQRAMDTRDAIQARVIEALDREIKKKQTELIQATHSAAYKTKEEV